MSLPPPPSHPAIAATRPAWRRGTLLSVLSPERRGLVGRSVCEGNYEMFFDNTTRAFGNDSSVPYRAPPRCPAGPPRVVSQATRPFAAD